MGIACGGNTQEPNEKLEKAKRKDEDFFYAHIRRYEVVVVKKLFNATLGIKKKALKLCYVEKNTV